MRDARLIYSYKTMSCLSKPCQTISRTATCWSRIFLECGLALNPPQIPSSQWCTATQKELCPATLWWLTPRSLSESWMHLEMRFSTGKHTHARTHSNGDKCDALMADAVRCVLGLCVLKIQSDVQRWSMWTYRGQREKERVRVQVRIHTRALHSCVIEFPSAHWPGFFLQMASCAWLHVCVRACVLARVRQPVRQLVTLPKKGKVPKSLHGVLAVKRQKTRWLSEGVWGGVHSKDHC